MMEFDKSRVYTALNADELEEGDVVIVADALEEIMQWVLEGKSISELIYIKPPTEVYRFVADDKGPYALAYLIAKHDDPYKEFKKAQAAGKEVWYRCNSGRWRHSSIYSFTDPVDRYSLTDPATEYKVFLWDGRFVYTVAEVPDDTYVYYTAKSAADAQSWCINHNKFAEVAKAWEEGQQLQYLIDGLWVDCKGEPSWATEHRVKPAVTGLKWTDLEVGDVIKKGGITAMVTGIDASPQTDVESDMHVHICLGRLSDEDLTEWEVVE